MRRNAQVAISVIFVGIIVVPMAMFVAGLRPRVVDNRAATDWPSLGGRALLEPDTYESIDGFLADRFPWRDRAVRLDAEIDRAMSVLDAVRPGAPSGKDGWLYLPETIRDDCPGSPPQDFFTAADEVARQAADSDISFVFTVIPDKAQVYPRYLPDGSSGDVLPGCSRRWRDAVEGAGDGRPWLSDLQPRLAALARDTSDLVYFRTDSHWTDLGALESVEALVNALAPDVWDPEELRPDGEETEVGDLTALLGLTDEESAPSWRVDRPGVSVDSEEERRSGRVIRSHATTEDAPLVEGTTVLIGDSFTLGQVAHIQPYFEDLVIIRWESLRDQELSDIVDVEPDAIVVQLVSRNVANDVYDVPLDRLARYLASL